MAIPTIQEAIDRGDVSIYLAANDAARGVLFGGTLAPGSAVSIALITDGLRWGYDGGAQTSESLRSYANYLVWLCGKWGQQAATIIAGGGGGSVIPIAPGGRPQQFNFEVDSSSFIATGDTTKQFPDIWKGWDLLFDRNGVVQNTIVSTESSYYSWNKVTAFLTLLGPPPGNGAAFETEKFQFSPV